MIDETKAKLIGYNPHDSYGYKCLKCGYVFSDYAIFGEHNKCPNCGEVVTKYQQSENMINNH